MSDPFVHLHVASGYSLQYGASHPHVLVERAAEQEMDILALTDRDGTYGAVKFAKACLRAGIRPVLGVDLAYRARVDGLGRLADVSRPPHPDPGRRLPRPAGRARRPAAGHHPRRGDTQGGRAGWAAVCRLISATHLAGERGSPILDLAELPDGVAELLASGDLMVLLGPASAVGVAATRRRDDLALAALDAVARRWCRAPTSSSSWSPTGCPAVRPRRGLGTRHQPPCRPDGRRRPAGRAVRRAHQRRPLRRPARRGHRRRARRLPAAGRARPAPRRPGQRRGLPQVRQADARDRRGDLPGRRAGADRDATRQLLADTRKIADRCALDPRADLGLGEVHFPEFDAVDRPRDRRHRAAAALRGGDRRPLRLGAAAGDLEAARRRAGDDPRPRLRVVLPHRRRRHRPDQGDGGAVRGARVGRRQPGQLPARRLRGRPDPARAADGAVPLAAARGAARHRHRRGVGAPARGLRGDPRHLRRRAVRLRLDDGHLPGPACRARRRRRARDAAGRDRRDRQGVPAHPGPRRPDRAARAAGAAGRRPPDEATST